MPNEVKSSTQLLVEFRELAKRYTQSQEAIQVLFLRREEMLDKLVDTSLRVPETQKFWEIAPEYLERVNASLGDLMRESNTSVLERAAQVIQEWSRKEIGRE